MGVTRTLAWLHRAISLALLALVGTSLPLWRAGGEFPQIPWLTFATTVPGQVDAVLLSVLGVATIGGLVAPGLWFARLQWLALLGLVVLDQHRLQPWCYQFLLLLGLLALDRGPRVLACCRAIAISVYAWSGLSKLDPGFFAGHGQMLLDGLLQGIGLDQVLWTHSQRQGMAAAMPVGEIAIAILLLAPRWRRIGRWGSFLMHGALLLTLGPWGLGHEHGVLIWNVFFIVQNSLLFRRGESSDVAGGLNATTGTVRVAVVGTAAAVILPALNPLGYWDHWPSWSVYSAHPAIVHLLVPEADVARLPESLRGLVNEPEPLQEWRRVRLDQWSFEQRKVPPYPQSRWRLAVANAVVQAAGLEGRVRVVVQERASWWDASRIEREWQPEQSGGEFWINQRSRGGR